MEADALVLREVNIRIHAVLQPHPGRAEYFCECGRRECGARVEMHTADFAAVVAVRDGLLVAAGHEPPSSIAVHRGDGYAVVVDLEFASLRSERSGLTVARVRVPVLVADEDMRLRDASAPACRLLGRSRRELRRLAVPDIVLDREPVEALYRKYLSEGEQHGRMTLLRKDGAGVEVDYHAGVLEMGGAAYHTSLLVPTPVAA